MSVRLSICTHISTMLPMDGFIWNLILETKNLSIKLEFFFKIGKNVEHFPWRPNYVLLFLVTLISHNSALFDWNGVKLFVRLSLCPPVCMSWSGFHWKVVRVIWYYGLLWKMCRESPNWIKIEKDILHLNEDLLSATLNRRTDALFKWNVVRLFSNPRRYRYFPNLPNVMW